MGKVNWPWDKPPFGPGVLILASKGEFCYREDTGKVYHTKNSSLYWCEYLQGKHYDWLRVKMDVGWVKAIEAQETMGDTSGQVKRDL